MKYAIATVDITRKMLDGHGNPNTNTNTNPIKKGCAFEFSSYWTFWAGTYPELFDNEIFDTNWAKEITEKEFCRLVDAKYLKGGE